MKCGEPKPDQTYAACDLELKHRDDHSYLGQRWPIEWRENPSAKPKYRWHREYRTAPAFDGSRKAVSA